MSGRAAAEVTTMHGQRCATTARHGAPRQEQEDESRQAVQLLLSRQEVLLLHEAVNSILWLRKDDETRAPVLRRLLRRLSQAAEGLAIRPPAAETAPRAANAGPRTAG